VAGPDEAAQVRRLCATVLIMEAIVIGLAIPVAITIEHVPHRSAGIAGGVLAGAAVLLAAVVARPGQRWTLAAGSVLQLAVIAAGVVVPAMFALGAVFAALWAVAIWLGYRYREAS
jgi:Protein of unknown function (DUF4233)